MDLLNDIGKKITETAKTVTRKSEDIVEVTKLNLTIGSEEDKIKRMLYEIGSELYRNFTDGKPIENYFDSKCNEVKQIEENIKTLKERILLLKGNKTCKTCNSVVDLEVNYCPNCGEKLENKEE
ncbi:MAG: hypothetical protein ACYCYE_03415 [Clostridia bacterium]